MCSVLAAPREASVCSDEMPFGASFVWKCIQSVCVRAPEIGIWENKQARTHLHLPVLHTITVSHHTHTRST